jgi:hypothetical protein
LPKQRWLTITSKEKWENTQNNLFGIRSSLSLAMAPWWDVWRRQPLCLRWTRRKSKTECLHIHILCMRQSKRSITTATRSYGK